MNLTSQHIPFERLADLAEDRLAGDERDKSLAHLSACSSCSAQASRLGEILSLMRTDRAEDPPRDVVAHAVNIFRLRAASAKPSVVRRVLAALSFDSMDLSPAFGVRSGQPSARQLLYSAGENDLDLRITPDNEAWVVSGQVLGQCTGGRIELAGVTDQATAVLNDLCEFTLPPLPTGSYTLRLHLIDTEIEIPEFELKA